MKATLLIVCGLCLNVFGGELPADAAALKAKRDAKVAEINRVYAAELEKLQKRAMEIGQLENATTIQKEIESVTPDPFRGETLWKTKVTEEMLVDGEWRFDVASPAFTAHLRFAPNQDVFERGKGEPVGKWVIRNGKIRAEFKKSWNEFDTTYTGSVVLNEVRFDGGKRDGVTLTRVLR